MSTRTASANEALTPISSDQRVFRWHDHASLWFSLATLVLLGAADMVSMVIRGAFVQLQTPDEMRGRVGAVNGLFIGASNQLGEFRAGVSAAWFGSVPAVLIGGVGAILVTGLWIRLFPALARRDHLHPQEPHRAD